MLAKATALRAGLFMSRTLRIFQVDAFTATPFTGNPASVVLDADGLTAGEMRTIAREIGKGDTAFVLAPAAADHDLAVRFFMPQKEAPFVGHATLAVHAVLCRDEPRALRRQRGASGIVEVRHRDGGFSITQPPPPLSGAPGLEAVHAALALLGLMPEALDPAVPPRIAGTASTRLLLAVRDAAALDSVRPQFAQLAALSPQIGAQGYFLFTREVRTQGCDTESRMFCPALGIDEDPVSGNAHAMLAVLLHEHGALRPDRGRLVFRGAQGRHVGRPGLVDVEVECDAAGSPSTVSIGGQAVIVFEGRLSL
jgi:PhzF family phenazine biosynthesis protein